MDEYPQDEDTSAHAVHNDVFVTPGRPREKFPGVIVGPGNQLIGTENRATETSPQYLTIKLDFVIVDQFKCFVELNALVRECDNLHELHRALVRFPKKAVRSLDVSVVAEHENIAHLADQPRLHQAQTEGHLYRMKLLYNSMHVQSAGLDVNVISGTRLYAEIDALKASIESGANELMFLFRARPSIEDVVSGFKEAMKEERSFLGLWHPNHRPFLQWGDYIQDPAMRPTTQIGAQLIFDSFEEYLTILGFATIREHEVEAEKYHEMSDEVLGIRCVEVPASKCARFFGLLSRPLDSHTSLQPGDSMKLNFDVAHPDTEEDLWTARVIAALPFAARGDISLLLNCPFNQETKQRQTLPFRPVPFVFDTMDVKCAKTPVFATVQHSNKTIKHQLNSLRNLQSDRKNDEIKTYQRTHTHLISRSMAITHRTDIYRNLQPEALKVLDTYGFDKSQQAATMHCRALPNGIGFFKGPPGTGKTNWLIGIILPFLYPTPEGIPHNQVLVVTPNNKPCDEFAQRMSELAHQHKFSENAIIIRAYPFSTEQDHIYYTSVAEGNRPSTYVEPIDDGVAGLLDEMSIAGTMLALYKQETKTTNGVADRRFIAHQLSTGTWMMRMAGFIGGHPRMDTRKHDAFIGYFKRYSEDRLDTEDMANFRAAITALRDDTIQKADIIVTTTFGASATYLKDHFRPVAVAGDEFARATECDVWHVYGSYKEPPMILVGDESQLEPVIKSDIKNNGFVKQLALSYFGRMLKLGHPHALFTTQYRMTAGLSEFTSNWFYQGQVKNAVSTLLINRPLSRRIVQFKADAYEVYGTDVPALIIKTKSFVQKDSTGSSYNYRNATAVLQLISKLMQSTGLQGADIIVQTFYQAQVELIRAGLRAMHLEKPTMQYNAVEVRTVDSMQGHQAKIIILDTVISTNIGFLRNGNRINVSSSRQMDGLFIIADLGGIKRINRKDRVHMWGMLDHYSKQDAVYEDHSKEISPYLPKAITAVTGRAYLP